MSYEGEMLNSLHMPARVEVEKALLESLFKHNGVIKEFGAREEIVEEIADGFGLTEKQRSAYLETTYRKENRLKKSYLWHRLLFRAADSLAKKELLSRPTKTFSLTKKREWMLTEKGFDTVLRIRNIPKAKKEFLTTRSFEVQKIVKKITKSKRPSIYDPIDKKMKTSKKKCGIQIKEKRFSMGGY